MKLNTKQTNANCFSPQNGVIGGAPWNTQGAHSINDILNFQAYGNDIYVGFFTSSSSTVFTYAFIISGWGDTLINLFGNGDFSTAIAPTVSWGVNPAILNSFQVDFLPNSGTITLAINGQIQYSFQDPNFQAGQYGWVMFSQYSSNVQICNGCFDPQNGVIGYADWQVNGSPFSGILNFGALGNDIYVGFFPSEQNSAQGFIYAFIIAGWGDTYVNLYTNGNWSNNVAGTSLTVNPNVENAYQIVFNNHAQSLTLYVNGAQVLSWVDSNYQGKSAAWVNFSQYSENVAICAPMTNKGPGWC